MRTFLVGSLLAAALMAAPAVAQSRATVREAQQALKDKGMYDGSVDGVNGPRTRAAIRSFQEKQNLTADGRIGPKTLDALGVREASPKTEFRASGENIKHSYKQGGKDVAEGSRELGHNVKHGEVVEGAKDFGKGVGHGAEAVGVGTGHAAKNVGKGVKNAVTGDSKR